MKTDRIHATASIVTLTLCAIAAMKIGGALTPSPHRPPPPPPLGTNLPMLIMKPEAVELSVVHTSAHTGSDSHCPGEALTGTGFVAREDGVIAAPRQLLENAAVARVRLRDGRVFDGRVTTDATNPFGIVRITAKGLPVCRFASTDATPLGAAATRSWSRNSNSVKTQLDIRPAGSPVVDALGRVVAVSITGRRAGESASGSRVLGGLGAAHAIQRLIAESDESSSAGDRSAFVPTAKLGILVTGSSREAGGSAPQSANRQEAVVAFVFPSSPAMRGGMRVGDVLVEIDGRTIRRPEDVAPIIRTLEPGRDAGIVVERFAGRVLLPVTVGGNPGTKRKTGA